MKKILLLSCAILSANAAWATTEYYTSGKVGMGDMAIYVDGDNKLEDYLVQQAGPGYRYDASGLLLDASVALGFDWSLGKMYVTPSPYAWLHLRAEGELGYAHYKQDGKIKNGYNVTDKVTVKMDQIFLLANGYADFRISRVVPYVGLGLGYSFGREEAIISNTGGEFSNSVDDNGIIYALHLGVAYCYSEITTLDLAYRRVYAPTEDDGLNVFGTLRLGARFRI